MARLTPLLDFADQEKAMVIVGDSSQGDAASIPGSYYGGIQDGCDKNQVIFSNMGGVTKCEAPFSDEEEAQYENSNGEISSCSSTTGKSLGVLICDDNSETSETAFSCEFVTTHSSTIKINDLWNIPYCIPITLPASVSPSISPTNNPTTVAEASQTPTSFPSSEIIVGGLLGLLFLGSIAFGFYKWKRKKEDEGDIEIQVGVPREFKKLTNIAPLDYNAPTEVKTPSLVIGMPRNVVHQAGMTKSGQYMRFQTSI